MAIDMFLKLEPVKGESLDGKHKDEIDVLSWSWGMKSVWNDPPGGAANTGLERGPAAEVGRRASRI